jgi:hypothetical protein
MNSIIQLLSSAIPPHSLDTERAIPGVLLLDHDSLSQVVDSLKPADFYKEAHRAIFSAVLALGERREPVDVLTVTEELTRRGDLATAGGAATLAVLAEEATTAANLAAYCSIVQGKALLRELIRLGALVIHASCDLTQVPQRVAVFRQQINLWVRSSRARDIVPTFALPDAPELQVGSCVSCGVDVDHQAWRCATCCVAVLEALWQQGHPRSIREY